MEFANLRIKDVDFAIRFTPDKLTFDSINKQHHIIGIHLSGQAEHYFKNKKLVLKTNTLYFFNKDEDYRVHVLEKGLAFSIHFTTYEPIDTESFCINIGSNHEIVNLLEKIERNISVSTCESRTLSNLYKLCAIFEEQRLKKYSKQDSRIVAAKEYIDLYFREKNCIENAAKTCNISVRHFGALFKNNLHTTPNKYITSKKMELAKKLLLAGFFSCQDVAEECGFSDCYYFSKLFKQVEGLSPTEYIKKFKPSK